MQFPDSYFEDEVREGFYISSLMKRAWAAQMEVLEAVRAICDAHHIRYFAEWGTLLGVVRHGGRIPWDDDIDICMLREDFDRFRSLADEELTGGCWFMDYRWNDDFDHPIGRIINSRVLVLEGERLEKYHGFPYVAGIDIYCMDDLPGNPVQEEEYFEQIRYVYTLIDEIRLGKEGVLQTDPDELEQHIRRAEKWCDVCFDRSKPIKQQLYAVLEKKVAPMYASAGAQEIANLSMWRRNRNCRLPKECYRDRIWMPFEYMEMPVPVAYEEVLAKKYGAGWMVPVRAGSDHDYPTYEAQQEFLKQEDAGQLFEYQFSREEMEKTAAVRHPKETLQIKTMGFLGLFHEAHEEIRRFTAKGFWQQAMAILGECQNAAIELGTMIEEEKGEGTATVHVLEQYCETIFHLHQKMQEIPTDAGADLSSEELLDTLSVSEKQLADCAGRELHEKKEVVFVPYKSSFWGAMESIWRAAVEDEETQVTVIPAPFYYKDAFGKAKSDEPHYETDYPPDVTVTSYEEYDFKKRYPDRIVIQCPYDEYNYGLTIHPFFYAKNLKQYTEQLVYIPPLVMDEISPEDDRARKMLKAFCNMPGVVHADTVIVQSEQMKEVYVELLTEFAGADTRQIWEKKILGLGSPLWDIRK